MQSEIPWGSNFSNKIRLGASDTKAELRSLVTRNHERMKQLGTSRNIQIVGKRDGWVSGVRLVGIKSLKVIHEQAGASV